MLQLSARTAVCNAPGHQARHTQWPTKDFLDGKISCFPAIVILGGGGGPPPMVVRRSNTSSPPPPRRSARLSAVQLLGTQGAGLAVGLRLPHVLHQWHVEGQHLPGQPLPCCCRQRSTSLRLKVHGHLDINDPGLGLAKQHCKMGKNQSGYIPPAVSGPPGWGKRGPTGLSQVAQSWPGGPSGGGGGGWVLGLAAPGFLGPLT